MTFEYKVVPAPTRGRKARGVKSPADRFAHALELVMNELAAEGWEYLRTDTLPSEERQGLTGRTTVYQNMLVFRRASDRSEETATAETGRIAATARVSAPQPAAERSTAGTALRGSLDTMIADELAAARAPRLPSADAAQATHPSPVRAPAVTEAKRDIATQ